MVRIFITHSSWDGAGVAGSQPKMDRTLARGGIACWFESMRAERRLGRQKPTDSLALSLFSSQTPRNGRIATPKFRLQAKQCQAVAAQLRAQIWFTNRPNRVNPGLAYPPIPHLVDEW
jgi:hypothetical protein